MLRKFVDEMVVIVAGSSLILQVPSHVEFASFMRDWVSLNDILFSSFFIISHESPFQICKGERIPVEFEIMDSNLSGKVFLSGHENCLTEV